MEDTECNVSIGTGIAARSWTDEKTKEVVMDSCLAMAFAERADELIEMLSMANAIIANAYGGDWEKAHDEWRVAAERFRDEFQALLHTKLLASERKESAVDDEPPVIPPLASSGDLRWSRPGRARSDGSAWWIR